MFQVTAVDNDLEGVIVYTLDGVFPVQSFFDVDSTTGIVRLRHSLVSDSSQNTVYTVSLAFWFIAYRYIGIRDFLGQFYVRVCQLSCSCVNLSVKYLCCSSFLFVH